jgi:conjugal transfer pilin signal peptidase TrbI
LRVFAERSAAHLKRWALVYVGLAALALWFHAHYAFGLNASPSLPHRLFLIHKGEMPGRGDFVAFRWAGGGPYPAGVTFIKVLAGVPGDEVTRDGEGFHVNGVAVGVPKPVSRQGQALEPGPTGRIPEGRFYVQGRAPGQPGLALSAHGLDPRVPDHREGACALLIERSRAARPRAGTCDSPRPRSRRRLRRRPCKPRTSA